MKTCFAITLLVLCCAFSAAAQTAPQATPTPEPCEPPSTQPIKLPTVVKRGAPIGDTKLVAFADALKEPQKFAGKAVVIEGVVDRVCKMEGCWMEIGPAAGAPTIRVTFKDHGFFVPKDADGLKFRAVGEFTIRKLDKEMVEHLVKEDGAKVKTNPDGTADEVTFIATGVELWKGRN
jgi:hypothetical protein